MNGSWPFDSGALFMLLGARLQSPLYDFSLSLSPAVKSKGFRLALASKCQAWFKSLSRALKGIPKCILKPCYGIATGEKGL
jgi:hypothetical protein